MRLAPMLVSDMAKKPLKRIGRTSIQISMLSSLVETKSCLYLGRGRVSCKAGS